MAAYRPSPARHGRRLRRPAARRGTPRPRGRGLGRDRRRTRRAAARQRHDLSAGLAVARDRRSDGEGEFRMLAVAPGARRVGASARRWSSSWSSASAAQGATAVVLCSSADMAAAHRIYDRLGFVRDSRARLVAAPGGRPARLPAGAVMADATLSFTVDRRRHRASRSAPAACPCSARRGCSRGARPPPAQRSSPTLADGQTSVGTRVELEHLAASPVGQVVEVTAATAYVDGRLHRFTVAAAARRRPEAGRLRRGHPGRRGRRAVHVARISPSSAEPLRGWSASGPSRGDLMSKTGRKRRGRKKKAANHGKRPNA